MQNKMHTRNASKQTKGKTAWHEQSEQADFEFILKTVGAVHIARVTNRVWRKSNINLAIGNKRFDNDRRSSGKGGNPIISFVWPIGSQLQTVLVTVWKGEPLAQIAKSRESSI